MPTSPSTPNTPTPNGKTVRRSSRGLPSVALTNCHNPQLVQMLTNGVIAVIARNSDPNSKKARQQVAADASDVHGNLAALGVNLGPNFPTDTDILDKLAAAPAIKHRTSDGGEFKSRTHIYDHSHEGWVLVVSAGTAKTVDEDGLQPWVETLRECVLRYEPGLVAATRLDRLLRFKWAIGRVLEPLERRNAFVLDECGLTEVNESTAVVFFIRASHAEAEARKTRRNVVNGYRRHTEPAMVNGVIAVAVPQKLPPGFTRRRAPGRGIGERASSVWVLDSPRVLNRHALELGAADQVANVRWVLAQIGRPGVTGQSLNDELIDKRQYSTAAIQEMFGVDATWESTSDQRSSQGAGPLKAIIRHLDLYRTGILTLGLGESEAPIVITDLFPTDGAWASAEDWERIDRYRAGSTSRECYRRNHFAGLNVTIDGTRAVLRSGYGQHEGKEIASYRCVGESGRLVTDRVRIPHQLLADVTIDAIRNAGDNAAALTASGVDAVEDAALLAEERVHTESAETAEGKAAAIVSAIEVATGALTPEFLSGLDERHTLLTAQAEQSRREAHRVANELARRRFARAHNSALRTDALLHLVRDVRSPSDHPLRDTVVNALANVTLTTSGHGNDRGGLRIDATVELHFNAGGTPWRSHGTASYTRPCLTHQLVQEKAAMLRAGTVPTSHRSLIKPIAAELNTDPGIVRLLCQITDERLLRIHAAFADRKQKPEAIAAHLDEPLELIERIRRIHDQRSTQRYFTWLRGNSPKLAGIYGAANEDPERIARWEHLIPAVVASEELARVGLAHFGVASEFTGIYAVGLRLKRTCPCADPAGLALLRLREATGSVCLACGRDSADVRWSPEAIERYAHTAEG
jgi:hypothetical protein